MVNHLVGEMVIYDNGPGTECVGIVLKAIEQPCHGLAEDPEYWLECLWDDGEIEGINSSEVSFCSKKEE